MTSETNKHIRLIYVPVDCAFLKLPHQMDIRKVLCKLE